MNTAAHVAVLPANATPAATAGSDEGTTAPPGAPRWLQRLAGHTAARVAVSAVVLGVLLHLRHGGDTPATHLLIRHGETQWNLDQLFRGLALVVVLGPGGAVGARPPLGSPTRVRRRLDPGQRTAATLVV